MTNGLRTLRLIVVGLALLLGGSSSAQELEPIGVLPKRAADWELAEEDQQAKFEAKSPFRWMVFRNKRTGDLLSIATHPDLGKARGLEYLSDTAIEIFPNGRAVWTQPHRDATTDVVTMKVVDIGRTNASFKGEHVLEYCFISEPADRDNLMAHGRAWVGPKGVVFAQHTSAKPITSGFVEQTMKSIIQDQKTRSEGASR